MFEKLRGWIDLILQICRIPVGVVAFVATYPAVQTYRRFWDIRYQLNGMNVLYFFIGFVGIFVVRLLSRRRRGAAETMEHEMTHVLFALLTFHPVKNVEVNDNGSGTTVFRGKATWLVALAPYFFPLCTVAMAIFAYCYETVSQTKPEWIPICLGACFGYNVYAFAQEIHIHQTDFKVAGWIFTLCFLPVANLLNFGMLFAFAERGIPGIFFFWKTFIYYCQHLF